MAKKILPKKVFIIWEDDSNEPFLNSATNIDDVKYAGAEVGVYELKSIRKFKLVEEK